MLFNPHLDRIPPAFFLLYGGVVVYTTVDAMYHISTLVGRLLLRQSVTDWPVLRALGQTPSIADFWSLGWHLWHQFCRHTSWVPVVRSLAHFARHLRCTMMAYGDRVQLGASFVLMSVSAVLERVWRRTTGIRVRVFWGCAWSMVWTLLGTFILD